MKRPKFWLVTFVFWLSVLATPILTTGCTPVPQNQVADQQITVQREAAGDPASSPNAAAFNHFFSVFIDEMLHLQLASNIAKALGVMPSYTSKGLVDANYGWVCYGPDNTVLPHILDFEDTIEGYNDIRVKLDALTVEQNRLFLAIEQNEKDAKKMIDPTKVGKYFPDAPFDNWEAGDELPMFGTIGHMYRCLWQYIEIEYDDGTRLFESVFNRGTLERDLLTPAAATTSPSTPRCPRWRRARSAYLPRWRTS